MLFEYQELLGDVVNERSGLGYGVRNVVGWRLR